MIEATTRVTTLPIVHLAQLVGTAGLFAIGGGLVGILVVSVLRWCSMSWSWALLLLLGVPIAFVIGWKATAGYGATGTVAVVVGAYWHYREVLAGGDLGERARGRRA